MASNTLLRLAILAIVTALALTGCMPISEDAAGGTVPEPTAAAETAAPVAGATAAATAVTASVGATATAIVEAGGAVATVATRSLRVRKLPTVDSAQIGSILSGESYAVTARSSNGMWLELDIPKLGGSGWVASDLVSMAGSIIDLPIVVVPTPMPTPTRAPTATPAPVQLPTPTPAAGEGAPVSETAPTAEPAEPTAIPTEAPTGALTEAPTAEATPTPTAAPIVPPPAGFAVVSSQVRLRVRSEPTTEADNIVGYAYPGEVFQVVERTADGAWTRVAGSAESRENPTGGWVTSEFLLFGQ